MQLTVPSKYLNSSAEQSDQHNSCVTFVYLCDALPNQGTYSKWLVVMQENFVVQI